MRKVYPNFFDLKTGIAGEILQKFLIIKSVWLLLGILKSIKVKF